MQLAVCRLRPEEVVRDGVGQACCGARDRLVEADRWVLEAVGDIPVESEPRPRLGRAHETPSETRSRAALASDAAENGASIEGQVESLGELGCGIAEEADLKAK